LLGFFIFEITVKLSSRNERKINSGPKAYLFAWNSRPERFDGYKKYIERIEKKGTCNLFWRCDTVKIQPGDRVFIMKLGKFPKGIIGSGKATSM
jgi:hypothetical protein